jgi:hypothetical protein
MENNTNIGLFVPTTNVWEVPAFNEIDPNLRELFVRLYQNINNIAIILNLKDSAVYNTQEFVNGQTFFPNPILSSVSTTNAKLRQVYRLVINFGALPNAATKSVPHNLIINSSWTFTRIYGCATNPNTEFIPLPYVSTTALIDGIELWVDTTNVNVKTGANYSAYTTTYIVLEYLKS